jgi:hypothetical protein
MFSIVAVAWESSQMTCFANLGRVVIVSPNRALRDNRPQLVRIGPKPESFLVLEGELAFFMFDDAGQITNTLILGRDALGVDIQPGVWHFMAVLTDHVVCFEVKPGPYSTATDKDFAPWAPNEGDPEAGAYLDMLASSVRPSTL